MLTNEFLRKPINSVPFLPAHGSTRGSKCKVIGNQYLLYFLVVGWEYINKFLGEPNGVEKKKRRSTRCQSSANANVMFSLKPLT